MVKVNYYGKETFMDGYLHTNLTAMRNSIRNDDDVLIIVDGKERIGKSVLGMQIGWFFSEGNIVLDDVCLTPKQFMDRVKEAKQYQTIIFDEAYLGMASEDSMRTYNRLLKKMLVTVGQKNLCLILILPSVFDLNKYAVLHRADALIHAYKAQGRRGMFSFYSNRNLKNLYIFGKKTYSYYKPSPDFYGRFSNFYPIDEPAYRKKKADTLNKFLSEQDDTPLSGGAKRLYRAIQVIKKFNPEITQKKIAEELYMSQTQVSVALNYVFKDIS